MEPSPRRSPPRRRVRDGPARERRSGCDPLHLGHDRPLEGRDDHPPKSASNALTLIDSWRFTQETSSSTRCRFITCTGCSWRCIVALLAGATMIYLPRFEPDAVIAAMTGATSLMGVPTYYTASSTFRPRSRGLRPHAPLRHRIRAPLAETYPAWRERGHRDPRTLRDDRDQHDHVEPL